MLVDHIGLVFFPHLLWIRMIGRLSMPLFAYAVATGYYFTARADAQSDLNAELSGRDDGGAFADSDRTAPVSRSRRFGRFPKYLLTMLIFAIVSQFPFYLMREAGRIFHFGLNIGFTWTLALILLHGVLSRKLLWQIAALIAVFVAWLVPIDYGLYGILYPLACYPIVQAVQSRAALNPTTFNSEAVTTKASGNLGYLWGGLAQLAVNLLGRFALAFWVFQGLALLSFPLMALDRGRKSRITKWFFYLFYPLHMLALALMHRWI